jgi:hypothetical protein
VNREAERDIEKEAEHRPEAHWKSAPWVSSSTRYAVASAAAFAAEGSALGWEAMFPISAPHAKSCPQCRAEYQIWASECSDCGVPLEFWSPPAHETLPPARELKDLWRGDPWQVRALAEFLASAGIPNRVDAFPPGSAIQNPPASLGHSGWECEVAVYVRSDELADALHLRDEFFASAMPAPPGTPVVQQVNDSGDLCPACAQSVSPQAESCPECGLTLFGEGLFCEACGGAVRVDDSACPHCGTRFDHR